MDNLEDLFYNTSLLIKSFLPEEEKYLLEYWDKIDFNKVRRVYKFEDSFKKLILTFCSIIDNIKKEKEEDSNDLKLYRELIKFLESYKELDIVIPGLEKSIPEFIEILANTNKENQSKLVHLENVTKTLNCLTSLNEKREYIESTYLSKLVKIKEDSSKTDTIEDESSYNPQIIDQNIKSIKNKQENVTKKLNYYLAESLKIGFNQEDLFKVNEEMNNLPEVESYKFYTEDNLLQQIKELKDQIFNQKNEYETEKKFLDLFKADYSREKEKKPHIYQEQISKITEMINITKNLVIKINKDYDLYISKIIDPAGITIKKELQEDFNNYSEVLFNFLGKKIDTIRHIDSEYKVDSIDLIKGIIKTREGKIIRLSDMGTGQSQSAYLTGLLNTSDNKKIIALFDEVAMMDDNSMEPIYAKFRELYETNKLIVGIVVQMSNEIKIIDIGDKYATRT
jgi:exonuclease SbcC